MLFGGIFWKFSTDSFRSLLKFPSYRGSFTGFLGDSLTNSLWYVTINLSNDTFRKSSMDSFKSPWIVFQNPLNFHSETSPAVFPEILHGILTEISSGLFSGVQESFQREISEGLFYLDVHDIRMKPEITLEIRLGIRLKKKNFGNFSRDSSRNAFRESSINCSNGFFRESSRVSFKNSNRFFL